MMKLVVLVALVCLVAAEDFSALDTNKNGVITKSEFLSAMPPDHSMNISDAQWNLTVCLTDNNSDRKMQNSEFEDFSSKMTTQGVTFLQEAGERCADETRQYLSGLDTNKNQVLEKSEYEYTPSDAEWTVAICLFDKDPEDKKLQISEFEDIWAKLSQENIENCTLEAFYTETFEHRPNQTESTGNAAAFSADVGGGAQQPGAGMPSATSAVLMQIMPAMQALQSKPSAGDSVSINMILFSLASLMAMIWN